MVQVTGMLSGKITMISVSADRELEAEGTKCKWRGRKT